MAHILDNPVWNALNTGNRNLSEGSDNAKRYRADVAPFVGLKENTRENIEELYAITAVTASIFTLVVIDKINNLQPWKLLQSIPLFQMVCTAPQFRKELNTAITSLTDEHIPLMMELALLTKPGPFRSRTIDFGHYQGIFDGDKPVAMAGQRMHVDGYAEISAVCTHPDYVGRGYAAQLMMSQIIRIKERNEIPFLHVTADNTRAIKIYEAMGFVKRSAMYVQLIKK